MLKVFRRYQHLLAHERQYADFPSQDFLKPLFGYVFGFWEFPSAGLIDIALTSLLLLLLLTRALGTARLSVRASAAAV